MGKMRREKMGNLSKIVPFFSDVSPISSFFMLSQNEFLAICRDSPFFSISPHFPPFFANFPHFPPFPPIFPSPCGWVANSAVANAEACGCVGASVFLVCFGSGLGMYRIGRVAEESAQVRGQLGAMYGGVLVPRPSLEATWVQDGHGRGS